MSISCTTCWSDGDNKLELCDVHSYLGADNGAFKTNRIPHGSPSDFSRKSQQTMALQSSKSDLQSNVGLISRKTKLAAECISMGHNRRYHEVYVDSGRPLTTPYD